MIANKNKHLIKYFDSELNKFVTERSLCVYKAFVVDIIALYRQHDIFEKINSKLSKKKIRIIANSMNFEKQINYASRMI